MPSVEVEPRDYGADSGFIVANRMANNDKLAFGMGKHQ